MQIYDPTVTGPERNFRRAQAIKSLEGKTIGILENNKLNAAALLQETAALFAERHGCKVMPIYSKTNASAPAPAEIIARVTEEVDLMITGLGD